MVHLRDGTIYITSNIYAPNHKITIKSVWSSLCDFRDKYQKDKWIVMGNFNTYISRCKKMGGSPIAEGSKMDLL